MAKEQLTKTGWITLHGLRFVKKFATREELIREIRGFFSRRGLRFGELKVVFRETRNPTSEIMVVEEGQPKSRRVPIAGQANGRSCAIVYITQVTNREYFLETLFHELDHIVWCLQERFESVLRSYQTSRAECRARRTAERMVRRMLVSPPGVSAGFP